MAAQTVWTIGRILKWTENFFREKGIESPRLDAEVLLAYLLQKERIYLYVHFDEPLERAELARFHEMVKKRVQRVPVAYILGEKEFMGLTFKVTSDTLVPRPDTEVLVQAAIERLKALGRPAKFADIGTGTGAICLSVLHYTEDTTAATVDISPTARAVAEENAVALGLTERVTFYTGDLLEPLKEQKFAAILSNPPYIPDGDVAGLQAEVRLSEPHTALAGGADGLDFYRRLCSEGPELLENGGFMAFEVGVGQAHAVEALAKENELIARTEIIKDLAGIERVVVAYRG
ncbi:MAG: peptide chain release factor N(5)-glutamine methyltransferase [Selenomonadaceae bacterium]|nr:peptide chain release factor N(5)-glutamine methyltransferase [Selenomonadaceae bacterium]MDD7057172.1 peptide chain release factor N(5)-glutamine methyltransferase [Selenomonadaceae bacterium]MDY3916715.1 peptide chain release factor N(5)-glutamine methyltransferase [Selenomonadaceae bacterium]